MFLDSLSLFVSPEPEFDGSLSARGRSSTGQTTFSSRILFWFIWNSVPVITSYSIHYTKLYEFSLEQALLSTLLSLALALPVARALHRRRFPGRALLLQLFGLSQVLPVIIALFGLVAVHGYGGWIQSYNFV